MRRPFYVIIPSRYWDILQPLLVSIEKHEDPIPETVVVWNGKQFPEELGTMFPKVIQGPDPFVFSKAINAAMSLRQDADVVLMNDDVRLVEPIFKKLRQDAYHDRRIGLISPVIDGGVGNPYQSYHGTGRWPSKESGEKPMVVATTGQIPICFVCVYLKREAADVVGPMDEGFTGYGSDDVDYCIRLRQAGYVTAITRRMRVQHGLGGPRLIRGANWSLSYARVNPVDPKVKESKEYFDKKWAGVTA